MVSSYFRRSRRLMSAAIGVTRGRRSPGRAGSGSSARGFQGSPSAASSWPRTVSRGPKNLLDRPKLAPWVMTAPVPTSGRERAGRARASRRSAPGPPGRPGSRRPAAARGRSRRERAPPAGRRLAPPRPTRCGRTSRPARRRARRESGEAVVNHHEHVVEGDRVEALVPVEPHLRQPVLGQPPRLGRG